MNTVQKAKAVIDQLLGESHGLSIVAIKSGGETMKVNGGLDGNYIYDTGYSGGDSNRSHIVIHSDRPLPEFDDFYGEQSDYPVVAQISAALEAAGFEGLEGFAAGTLRKSHAGNARHQWTSGREV
jgi:hypothetical protein